MKYSIAGIMNMNMFGIPHVGADVCGFYGDLKENEMCSRWIQLATFYPNSRVHQNNKGLNRTEPYLLPEPYKTKAQKSISDRYQYLRMMYTCLYEVSRSGGSCFDPLFFHYPTDDNLLDNIEESFIVASALKVSPVLAPLGIEGNFTSYFPSDTFVDLANFANIIDTTTTGGSKIDLSLA
jgi:alpha-glucosidase (family GH31 glycosyl hydrolase)